MDAKVIIREELIETIIQIWLNERKIKGEDVATTKADLKSHTTDELFTIATESAKRIPGLSDIITELADYERKSDKLAHALNDAYPTTFGRFHMN